jgi:hypothetical protein
MVLACIMIFAFTFPLFAQNVGGGSGGYTDGGGTGSSGGTGSGSYYGGGSSSTGSSSSSSGSSGTSSPVTTETSSPIGAIELQDFDSQRSTFIGVDPSVKFIGKDEIFDSNSSSSSRRVTTSSSRASTRTTTTRRTSAANRSTSQSTNAITNSGRAIASTATFEPDVSIPPTEILKRFTPQRLTELKTKMLRLPKLKLDTERLDISVVSTSSGIVAELSGVVGTEREGKILKQFLLLEPGIDQVKNELKIEPATNLPK